MACGTRYHSSLVTLKAARYCPSLKLLISIDAVPYRPKDVIDLLLLTQYFDMLKDVGMQDGTRAVFLPRKKKSQIGAVRDGLLQAQAGRN